jgi:hypothetical protein
MIVRVIFIFRKRRFVYMRVILHLQTKENKLIGNRLDNYIEVVQ